MISPDVIIMHFSESSGCECWKSPGWVNVDISKVLITLDLRKDEYRFETKCDGCCCSVLNTRSAFR